MRGFRCVQIADDYERNLKNAISFCSTKLDVAVAPQAAQERALTPPFSNSNGCKQRDHIQVRAPTNRRYSVAWHNLARTLVSRAYRSHGRSAFANRRPGRGDGAACRDCRG